MNDDESFIQRGYDSLATRRKNQSQVLVSESRCIATLYSEKVNELLKSYRNDTLTVHNSTSSGTLYNQLT